MSHGAPARTLRPLTQQLISSSARLAAMDLLDRERILEGLATRAIGADLHLYDEVTSTNDVATALADAGAPHGAAVVAERQTRGRGRLGRPWASPPGVGIWVSVILRPPVPAGGGPAPPPPGGPAA